MISEIQIKNSAGVCRIEIEGTIGVPEEWQFDQPEARVATYEKFRDTVRRIAGIEGQALFLAAGETFQVWNPETLLACDAVPEVTKHYARDLMAARG